MTVGNYYERDFYSFKEEDGTRDDSHESRMANDIEAPFNKLLPILRSRFYACSWQDAEVIVRYVANLFNRSHQRRRASHVIQKQTGDAARKLATDHRFLLQLAAAFSFVLDAPVDLRSLHESIISVHKAQSDQEEKSHFLRNLVSHEAKLAQVLRGRRYGVLLAPPKKCFLLSDTGLITRRPGPYGGFSVGVGFSFADMHALLPISPSACLQVGLPVDRREIRADEVDEINFASVRLMHRHVFSPEPIPGLKELVRDHGSSLRYSENTFLRRKITPEILLDSLVFRMLGSDDNQHVELLRKHLSLPSVDEHNVPKLDWTTAEGLNALRGKVRATVPENISAFSGPNCEGSPRSFGRCESRRNLVKPTKF